MEAYRWHEQPANKHLYEAEVNLLENGLEGDFELVELLTPAPDGRIAATGWLKYECGGKHGIRIVFPTKYPFKQPTIFVLSSDPNGQISLQVQLFGKGNQYNNGAMCLMRADQWDEAQHNIGSHLRRAQRWLMRATSPEGFPKEEIVEEIPAALPHTGQVLMGRSFEAPPFARTGRMLLTQFKPNYYILEENVLPVNPFVLQVKKEVFTWYALNEGITFKDLFPEFTIPRVLQVFREYLATDPESLLTNPNIAFYLPDDPNPWHFFKFGVIPGQGFTGQACYYITRIIEKELYHRTKDVFDDIVLSDKKVTIIGLGALGSEVARSLARNGVGHFNLIDNDTFEVGNSVRHAADLFYVGELKTLVARQLIHRSNPNITVNEFPIDVLDDLGHLEQCLLHSDLCLVLTADEHVDYFINEAYIPKVKIPFIFARVTAGGLSGSVQVVQQEKTACLKCLAHYGADTLPAPNDSKSYKELSPEYGSCSLPAVPGSEVDTKEVALQVSRLSLQLLLEGHGSTYAPRLGDQYYWHGPLGSTEQEPFTWEIKRLEKHCDCEICNP